MDIKFKPTKRQFEAFSLFNNNYTNEILYGGGARGGKSYFLNAVLIIKCLEFPGSAWLVGRNELKRLRQTTLLTFFEVAKSFGIEEGRHFNYNAQESVIKFKNGSIIFLVDLSYMPSDPNYDRLGSYGLTGAFIDEAQEINEKAINVLKGRFSLLQGNGWKTIPKMLYTCNPAKNWIYYDFYKPSKNGTLDRRKAFVPSLVTDNPYISQDYIDQLKTADKVTIERLLKGNFDYDDTPGKLYNYDKIIDMWTNPCNNGAYYITCDVARMGKDKTVIFVWDGWEVIDTHIIDKSGLDEVAQKIQRFARGYNIGMSSVIVDEDGVGGGLVDILQCRGFVNNSRPLSPHSSKYVNYLKRNYTNLKTQCYFLLQQPIETNLIKISDKSIKELLVEELDVVSQIDIDKDVALRIIKKEDVKEKLGRSPDFSDSLMMRMYFELNPTPTNAGSPINMEPESTAYPFPEDEEGFSYVVERPVEDIY